MGSPIGQVVGAFFASYPMEWFGRKKTFGACVVVTAGFVFIQFFARSLPVLLVGELLGGLVSIGNPVYDQGCGPLTVDRSLERMLLSCYWQHY